MYMCWWRKRRGRVEKKKRKKEKGFTKIKEETHFFLYVTIKYLRQILH